jgi:Zn-dependent protease with chaperone function
MPDAPATEVRLRTQPLWARVDANRVKLGAFVALFVAGSALLLASALVAVPGALFGWANQTWLPMAEPALYWERCALAFAAAVGVLLLLGGVAAAVQLANAEDWVHNRFKGAAHDDDASPLTRAVSDMAVAAGLAQSPRVSVLDLASVNAFAIGTTRKRPLIGVTRGMIEALSEDELRAVVATLTARIIAGDIMFGTALAALMGPLKAVRESRKVVGEGAGCAAGGCADPGCAGCGRGCADLDGCSGGGCLDGLGDIDSDSAGGCLAAIVIAVFVAVVVAITYVAVVMAAWIVTLWGRLLQRTTYEKADAEGMLLLKDPAPMLSALRKAVVSSTEVGDGDPSYDGIFYAATSGTPRIERAERRRFDRLREVLGVEGAEAVLPAE